MSYNPNNPNGQATMANSQPVVLPSDQSAIPISVASIPSHAVTNAGTFAVQAAGDVAAGAADSGNPVKAGGKYNATNPTLTDGNRGDLQLGLRGSLRVELFTPGSTVSAGYLVDNADGVAAVSSAQRLGTVSRGTVYNGTNWDRAPGDATNGADVNVKTSVLPTGSATSAAQTDKSQFTKLTDGTDTALITASGEQNVLESNSAAIAASLSVIDDWDESDRAKTNPIVGQTGVQGGSGAVSANTQRTVLATDVNLPATADQTASGNITGNGQSISLTTLNSTGMAVITITGGAALTVALETTADGGTTWTQTPYSVSFNNIQVASVVNPSGIYYMPTVGMSGVRVRSSAYTSGTAAVSIRASANSFPAAFPLTYANGSSDGATISDRALQTYGATLVYNGSTYDRMRGDTTNGLDVDVTRLPALVAGTAVIGKVGIDQTTPGTTNLVALAANQSVNVAQINGVTTLMGNGASGTGAQRVTIANDSTGILAGVTTVTTLTGGGIAHDSADSGNPIKIGMKAETSPKGITVVADGDRTDAYSDADGLQMVKVNTSGADLISERVTDTGGTSTAFSNFTAVASTYNYVTAITVYNSSATAGFVDIRDGTAGSVKWTMPLPAGGGSTLSSTTPLFKSSANTALAFDVSGALSTVYISMSGFQSKV